MGLVMMVAEWLWHMSSKIHVNGRWVTSPVGVEMGKARAIAKQRGTKCACMSYPVLRCFIHTYSNNMINKFHVQ
jgi:hypothetical protein